jgi:hypothetical protein
MTTHAATTVTPDRAELRKFGLIFGTLVIGAFGLLIPWIWDLEIAVTKWPWPLGGFFILWALVHPGSLGPVYRVWMKFGHAIGWFNTRLILGLVFFAIFFPVAVALKLLRKDPMARKLDAGANSYRVASKAPPREQLERPY